VVADVEHSGDPADLPLSVFTLLGRIVGPQGHPALGKADEEVVHQVPLDLPRCFVLHESSIHRIAGPRGLW
jgi:hypothetical protein